MSRAKGRTSVVTITHADGSVEVRTQTRRQARKVVAKGYRSPQRAVWAVWAVHERERRRHEAGKRYAP